ncbi:MAG: hypothetical protein M1820_005655 [Bogoriella megaspora]|nr:MAG: hypothetical protein M1820_005655 [Bogoriella megaspora]
MDPLSITASIIAVIQLSGSVISAVYNYRRDAKNASEDAIKVVQDLTGLSQILEKLLQMIEKDKNTKGTRLESLEVLIKPDGPLETCQQTLEKLSAKLQPEKGWRLVKQSLTWPLKADYVKKALDEIATAKATLAIALTVDQTSLALETKDTVDALASSLDSFRLGRTYNLPCMHQKAYKGSEDEKRKAALSKISPTDATANHVRVRKKHHEGTGAWLLGSEKYSAWLHMRHSLLWINGILHKSQSSSLLTNLQRGVGRRFFGEHSATVLLFFDLNSSIAVDDLIRNRQRYNSRLAVAYYYFDFQTSAEQQFHNLLRFFILQLSCQLSDLPPSVEAMGWRRDLGFSDEYLQGVVEEIFPSFDEVYIVIDAIDECEQSGEVLKWVQNLLEGRKYDLHLLVASRQDHQFRSTLGQMATFHINLDEQTFDKDIRLYVRDRINGDSRMKKWPTDVQESVERSLLANAGGLFRWVDCQLDTLRKCLRTSDVVNVLMTPPKTLNETYDRILSTIDDAYVEDACRILQWLAFAARPLSPIELNDVIAFDQSDPLNVGFDPGRRLSLIDDVLALCSSLVAVSNKEIVGSEGQTNESVEVRLAHNTVKDYLLSREIKKGSSTHFALEASLSHSIIAESCLIYLLHLQPQLDESLLREFPLAVYAGQFWTKHYVLSEMVGASRLDPLALQLLTDEGLYEICCYLYNPDRVWRRFQQGLDPAPPALYYASLSGLSRIISSLVDRKADPNKDALGCAHGGPLGAASHNGNGDTVQALLGAGAEPDGSGYGGIHGTPIASAASQGHTRIVELLLSVGADVNRMGIDGQGAALFQAVAYSHLETVKVLLDTGADANAYAGLSGVVYAIEIAARRDDRASVRLLFPVVHDVVASRTLDAIASAGHRELFQILLQTERGRAMGLSPAARAGWHDIVQSLIDERVQDVLSDSQITAAIREAAASGSLETAQVLYENAAEAANFGVELNKGVAAAASYGYSLVVKYLLDRGADANSKMCQRALFQAVQNGHLSTVQILLIAGVDARSQIQDGWSKEEKSCLWAAVDRERIDIARILLASGADVDTRYGNNSALTISIQRGNEQLFDILLQEGASIMTPPIPKAHYDMLALPVHCAASVGNAHMLRTLLEAGLDADEALSEDGWTALFHAAKAGREEILWILINDYSANVNRRANKGTVAIHTASYHNHSQCVKVFLAAGVDVNVRGHKERTSLHWAVKQGSIDAVRVLLENGADVSLEEKDTCMTAVDIAQAKALDIFEAKKSNCYWKGPHDENYESILHMLEGQKLCQCHN